MTHVFGSLGVICSLRSIARLIAFNSLNDSHVPPRHTQNTTSTPTHFGSAGLPVSKKQSRYRANSRQPADEQSPILDGGKKIHVDRFPKADIANPVGFA
jgi:hypothetical protein